MKYEINYNKATDTLLVEASDKTFLEEFIKLMNDYKECLKGNFHIFCDIDEMNRTVFITSPIHEGSSRMTYRNLSAEKILCCVHNVAAMLGLVEYTYES